MSTDDSAPFETGLTDEDRERLAAIKASNQRFANRVTADECREVRRLMREGTSARRAGDEVGVSGWAARHHAKGLCDHDHADHRVEGV